jgi:hypothetical protein
MSTKILWLAFADTLYQQTRLFTLLVVGPQSCGPLVANHREDVCQTLSSMGERVNAEGTSDESHFPWKKAQVRCFEGRVGYVVDRPSYL